MNNPNTSRSSWWNPDHDNGFSPSQRTNSPTIDSEPLSPFAQFLRETDEKFYATFPQARPTANTWQMGYNAGGQFQGTYFSYNAPKLEVNSIDQSTLSVSQSSFVVSSPVDVMDSLRHGPAHYQTYGDIGLHRTNAPSLHPLITTDLRDVYASQATERPKHDYVSPVQESPVRSAQFTGMHHPYPARPALYHIEEVVSPATSTQGDHRQLDDAMPIQEYQPTYAHHQGSEVPYMDSLLPSTSTISVPPSLAHHHVTYNSPLSTSWPGTVQEQPYSPINTSVYPQSDRDVQYSSSDHAGAYSPHSNPHVHHRPLHRPISVRKHGRAYAWVPHHTPSPRLPVANSPPPPSRRHLEKKPPLACLFCRGRKIACGPPVEGSPDRTCNQCSRRSLRCEYPRESHRGMRKKKSFAGKINSDGPKVVLPKTKH